MDVLTLTDLLITNGVLAWVSLRLVKRVDTLDSKVDDHEIRLSLTEKNCINERKNKTKSGLPPDSLSHTDMVNACFAGAKTSHHWAGDARRQSICERPFHGLVAIHHEQARPFNQTK